MRTSTLRIPAQTAVQAACACYPLNSHGEPMPWSLECEVRITRVRDFGYRLEWCPGGHFMILEPGAPVPRRCPLHEDGA